MSSMQCSKVNQISVQDNEPVGTLSPANHKKIWKNLSPCDFNTFLKNGIEAKEILQYTCYEI